MYLDPYSEIIGILHTISEIPYGAKAVIIIQKEIILSINPGELKPLLGKHVRIFNNNGEFIIKEVK